MLRTGKQMWEASAKRQALSIRQAELQFHIDRYNLLIGNCSILVGFALDAVVHMDVPWAAYSPIVGVTFFGSMSLCIMLSVYVVVVGSCLTVFANQLALLGSEGESLERAVHHLRAHRFSLFGSGFIAFFSLISAGIALAWIKMGPMSAVITGAFLIMAFCTLSSISSIYFSLGQGALVTGETQFFTSDGSHFDLATLQPNVASEDVFAEYEREQQASAMGAARNGHNGHSSNGAEGVGPFANLKRMLEGRPSPNAEDLV